MTRSIDQLRRDAKALRKAHDNGDPGARQRVRAARPRPEGADLKHADFLHVIACERGFASWPALVAAADLHGLDRAARIQRLTLAMAEGQDHVVRRLLADDPGLTTATLALAAGFHEAAAVDRMLTADPEAVHHRIGAAPPFIHFCRSRMHRLFPDRRAAMLSIADRFVAAGVDVNAGLPWPEDPAHLLSPLYFALGHAGNLPLAAWLLDHGADPNDGESLYHATELGHPEGLRLLLAHGADPRGTNALARALDFDDAGMVALLLDAGADPNEVAAAAAGGEAPMVVPCLHHAARRLCSAAVCDLLLAAGADPHLRWQGKSAFATAAVYGNAALADRLAALGAADDALTPEETLLAAAARGADSGGAVLDPARLDGGFRDILRHIVHLPGKDDHVRRLVALGVEYDRPDPLDGMTPVQVAGWEGLPAMMGYLISLRPDLSHVNGYGGTLLSSIIHGSENNPDRAGRDHVGCLRIALEHGVALPRRAAQAAGDPKVAAFLADWAEARPGQVVEYGVT